MMSKLRIIFLSFSWRHIRAAKNGKKIQKAQTHKNVQEFWAPCLRFAGSLYLLSMLLHLVMLRSYHIHLSHHHH